MRIEYRALPKDGRALWLEAHPRGIFHPTTGALIEIQDVVRDVSARKALVAETVAAKEAAESATAVKTEFLANISHELRTPLTSIIGYAGLLDETLGLSSVTRRHIELIRGASRTLLALVNGILDFSRLEAGRITLRPMVCSPGQIGRECLDLLSLQALEKGLRLECVEADGLPAFVSIDPDAFRQVLVNLIGNAVKFTATGQVRLNLEFKPDAGALSVSVEDTGPGIPPREIEKLFQRFSQVDGSSTRGQGGAGLGLAICKGLIEAMGGVVEARSTVGAGSVFSFSIPAPAAEAQVWNTDASQLPTAGARVLVVDDNVAIRDLARTILQSSGAEVTEAEDGAGALAAALHQPFDVILLDLRMQGLSGREVAASLRSKRGPNRNAPIVAFTAEADAVALNRLAAEDSMPCCASQLMHMTSCRW